MTKEVSRKTTLQRISLGVAIIGIPAGLILFFTVVVPSFQESVRSGSDWNLDLATELLAMAPIVLGIVGMNVYLRGSDETEDSE